MAWVPGGGSSSSGFSWGGTGVDKSIDNYKTRLGAVGFTAPAQNKDSTLSTVGKGVLKAIDVLNRPLDAVEVGVKYAMNDKPFLQGAKRGITGQEQFRGADMLRNMGVDSKVGRGVGGFAIDMALDPLNAVTFGTGSLLKGVVKGGASMSEKGLIAAENLARGNALREARLALQQEKNVGSFKALAKTFEGADRAHQADAAIRAKAFSEVPEQEILRKARLEATQRASRNAGKGLSIFGQSIVSGQKLQDIGGIANKGINKLPLVPKIGEATAKAFDPAFVKGLDASERTVLKQIRGSQSGQNSLRDIQDAEKFRDIATLQRGVTIGGKPVDRVILDIISKRGEGVSADDWNTIITTTDRQRKAWQNIQRSMGDTQLKPDATLMDLANVYSRSFKGIGMKEKGEGVLSKLVDEGASGTIKYKEDGSLNSFSNYVPHTINREFDKTLRKGSMTRNFNVRNDFNQMRNEEYQNMSISEINDRIREKARARGEQVPDSFEFLETSALNALMTRQLTSNKVLADKHTVDSVLNTFGKRVARAEEVKKAMYDGYDIVVPNASVNVFHVGRLPRTAGSEETNIGLEPVGKGMARGVKNLIENNGNVLQKLSEQDAATFVGNVNMTMYALPKGIAEKFNRQAKIQLDDGAASLGKMVDRFYSMWKPLVTGLRPQYHARNLASSGFNNFLDLGKDMFDPATQRAAALVASAGGGVARNMKVNIRGTEYTTKQIHEMMVENGALNTYFLTDTNSISRGISEDIARNNTGKMAERLVGKPAELGRATGNRVEEYSRAVNFIAHLKQGFTPAEAADISKKIHFDYQDLTEFEQGLKRVLPFYTWARKNVPLQLESFLNNPTPYLAISRAQESGANVTGTDVQNLPDYARRDFVIPVGGGKVLSMGLPAGDLFMNSKDVAGMLNPLAKIPLEMYTNQNFLTQGSLNSYPEESAIGLGEGNSLIAKGLQNMPWLQKQLEEHPGAATTFSRLLGSTGVINDVQRYAFAPETEGGVLQGTRDANNTAGPLGFAERMLDPNMVKNFNETKGAQSRDYAYQRQLGNIVQMLKAKGYTVPDMQDLKSKKKSIFY